MINRATYIKLQRTDPNQNVCDSNYFLINICTNRKCFAVFTKKPQIKKSIFIK